MALDSVTLALEGEITLEVLADGLDHFKELVLALTQEVAGPARIEWIVEDLRPGSALATCGGRSHDMERVERVVRAYLTVGRSLEENKPIPFSDRVQRHSRAIVSVLSAKVTSVRFETPEDEATIVSSVAQLRTEPRALKSYGAIEGRIQTLTNRGSLRFTLYDTLNDKAVTCYLSEDEQERLAGLWGKRTIVEGIVTRDPVTGRPVNIRQVRHIEPIPDVALGGYASARGAVPIGPDDPKPEDLIRRFRDAG